MVRFFLRVLFFVGSLGFAYVVLVLVLPIQTFTNRSWEALRAENHTWFPGVFYPNQTLYFRSEQGDTGMSTEYKRTREVIFTTGDLGMRNAPEMLAQFDTLMIGDSFLVGPGLTQADIVQSKLHDDYGLYPYATGLDMVQINRTLAVSGRTPETVIWVGTDYNFMRLVAPTVAIGEPVPDLAHDWVPMALKVQADRVLRHHLYAREYLFSRNNPDRRYGVLLGEPDHLLFREQEARQLSVYTPAEVVATLDGLLAIVAMWEAAGVDFVFVPVPNKITIYYDWLPEPYQMLDSVEVMQAPVADLIVAAEAAGVRVVDTLSLFNAARDRGEIVYQYDDTHWNARGVEIIAEAIVAELGE
jgi:alginate O-acetyltransferase complex protein AlgJ